jgi:hypothetical protein
MNGLYSLLSARIRQELAAIEQVVGRAERALTLALKNSNEQDLYLDAVALNLHDFYSGLERLFTMIGAEIDGVKPEGPAWHRDLLSQMTLELKNIRPAVLSPQAAKAVDEYLRFRHIVRNVYTFELDPDRVERLVKNLRPAFAQVQTELLAFADFLEKLV